LIDYPFTDKRLDKARDIFIFCTFTGLSYTDVKHLTYDHIQSSFDGNLWIKGRRKKTDIEYNIPLLNIPKMILEKYKGKTKDNLVLPVYHNIIYNKILKEMAKECCIDKRVSSHLARHTFATLTLTQGISIESVSKMLGHTNISTTQTYAKITNKKIGNEMNMFAGNVKKWDVRLQLSTAQEELGIESVLQSNNIREDGVSDSPWKHLALKIWYKLSNIERQSFALELENREEKPGTMQDFYVLLMDYFLGSIKNDNADLPENTTLNPKTQFAVIF
jgi:hypothetical protein